MSVPKRMPLPAAGAEAPCLVEITVVDEQSDHPIDTSRWMTLAERVLAAEGVGVRGRDVELSMVFIDEPAMRGLNEQYVGKEGATDVLSFPIDEEASRPGPAGPDDLDDDGYPLEEAVGLDARLDDDRFREDSTDDEAPLLLGDIVICPAYAARNAPQHAGELHDGSLDDEIALLVVHGCLHLLGMDHVDSPDAQEMEAREREHLRRSYKVSGTLSASPPRKGEP